MTVTLTNAEGYVVPSDPRQAINYVYEKLKKLLSERKANADGLRDVVKSAKKAGYSTKAVRHAMKLDRMTPEQREAWREQLNTAAALFGMTGLSDADSDERDQKLWEHVQQARYWVNEQKDLGELFKDLRAKAAAANVDYAALAYLVRNEDKKEADENHHGMNWMERLDAMAGSIGYW